MVAPAPASIRSVPRARGGGRTLTDRARIATACRIAGRSARGVVARAGIATALAVAVSALAVELHPDTRDDAVDTAVGWLHLPVLAGVVTGIAVVVETWPAFGRDRSDASWIRRLRLGPFDGALIAAAGAVAAVAVCLLAAGLAFEILVRRAPAASITAHVPLRATGEARLDAQRRSIELSADIPVTADTIELRPQVAFARGGTVESLRLHVTTDELDLGLHELPAGGGLIRIHVGGARIARLRVSLAPGVRTVVLLPEDSARAIARTSTPVAWNAALAAASGTFTVMIALGLAILGHRYLSTPVLHVLAVAAVLLSTASGIAPVGAAIAAHARDTVAWGPEFRTGAIRASLITLVAVGAAAVLARSQRRSSG